MAADGGANEPELMAAAGAGNTGHHRDKSNI